MASVTPWCRTATRPTGRRIAGRPSPCPASRCPSRPPNRCLAPRQRPPSRRRHRLLPPPLPEPGRRSSLSLCRSCLSRPCKSTASAGRIPGFPYNPVELIGMADVKKVVLAYSGGLDTSVILKWLQDTYNCEVVTFTADLGQGEEVEPARAKAQALGVKEIYIDDLREEFVRDFVYPMFRANTIYEGEYLLGTSIA